MEKTYKDCQPRCCGKDLLSNEGVYMTNEVIKEKCDCTKKAACFEILRLLKDSHRPEALDMIKHTR